MPKNFKLLMLGASISLNLVYAESNFSKEEKARIDNLLVESDKDFALKGTELINSLEDALLHAYQYNPEFLSKKTQLRKVFEDKAMAMSAFKPTIQAQAGYNYDRKKSTPDKTKTDSIVEAYDKTLGISLKQNLFRSGGDVAGLRAADFAIKSAIAGFKAIEQKLNKDVITAQLDVIASNAKVEAAHINQKQREQDLKAEEMRKQLQATTETNLMRAAATFAQANAALIQERANLESHRATHQQLTGLLPGKLSYPKNIKQIPRTVEEIVQLAEKNNPELINLQYQLEASKAQVDAARSALLFSVDLNGSLSRDFRKYDKETDQTLNGTVNDASVGVTLSVPLYTGDQLNSKLRQAKIQQRAAALAVQEKLREIRASAGAYLELFKAAEASKKHFEIAVPAYEETVKGARYAVELGSKSNQEISQDEYNLFDIRKQAADAQKNYYLAYYNLLGLIGALSAKDLGVVVEDYNPVTEYNKVVGWLGYNDDNVDVEDMVTPPELKARKSITADLNKKLAHQHVPVRTKR